MSRHDDRDERPKRSWAEIDLDALGPPNDAALIAAFLDARERDVQLAALGGLRDGLSAGRLGLTAGLRAQLRSLSDELAEMAEFVLAAG